jgi:GntR family carbon starvation induced transcriptional regulator
MSLASGRPEKARTDGRDGTSATLASSVYERLREDILSGHLPPSEKLRVESLRRRYDVGNSPLREALNRLSVDGLVVREDQKGFSVASVSARELAELVETRCWLEEIALRRTIAARDDAWEEKLVLAYHRLTKTTRSAQSDQFQANPEWEQKHREFHMALIANCGSALLLQFCAQMNDLADRYCQLAITAIYPQRNEKEEHRLIMDATIDGRADEAVDLLTSHFRRTGKIVIDAGIPLPE